MNLDNFLNSKFNNIELKSPMFYRTKNALRFELNDSTLSSKENIKQIYLKAITLFNEIIRDSKKVWLVAFVDVWEKYEKVKAEREVLNNLKDYVKSDKLTEIINKKEISYRYPDDDMEDTISYRFDLNTNKDQIDVNGLIKAEVNQSLGIFPTVTGDWYFITSEPYFIYHLYDFRGLDIVSNSIENLMPLFKKYYYWTLEYDRNDMKHRLSKS